MRWLRRLIRRNMKPIPHDTAHIWKRRFSLAYGFFAWNAIAMVAYAFYQGKRDWASFHGLEVDQATPAQQFALMMDIPKAKVIRIGQKTETYEIDNTETFEKQEAPSN